MGSTSSNVASGFPPDNVRTMASLTTIGVRMLPGATAFTFIPKGASSMAADLTRPMTPHFAAQ